MMVSVEQHCDTLDEQEEGKLKQGNEEQNISNVKVVIWEM